MSTSTVFINYRRSVDAYAAALLDVELSRRLGEQNIFRASRSIPPGVDFEEAIDAAIGQSKAMLVLVGPRWAETFRAGSHERDYVLEEIVEAMKRDILLIPVLLAGAPPIRTMRLPDELERLEQRQYLRFDYRAMSQDSDHIAQRLRMAIPELVPTSRRSRWRATCG
ncbi:MAG: toll/interleukin-1 receptor domain-containing protein [Mycobacteriales bacterium]